MHSPNKVNPHVRGRAAAAKARRKRESGCAWFGLLTAAIQDDQENRQVADLDEGQVLDWADAFFERTGAWPRFDSGAIPEAPGETWLKVAASLQLGIRGFSPGGSLPRLLAAHRGRYNQADQNFSIKQILAWADAWHSETADWPTYSSGHVPGAGGLSWCGVNAALDKGRGGLPGGSSLSQLLAAERGVIQYAPLTEEQILIWADAHHARTGAWPSLHSGPISESPEENWAAVNTALNVGYRGLPGGSSLARFLMERRGSRSLGYLPPLEIPQILGWADAFHARTGRWPTASSGPVAEAPEETWSVIYYALVEGSRGLPGGWSLIRLLAQERGVHSKRHLPRMTIPEILRWADAHHSRTGKWPTVSSGPIPESPGDTWSKVEIELVRGGRGLEGGSSLAQLLAEQRGRRHLGRTPDLTVGQILAWADNFHACHGRWPKPSSGRIPEAPGETWSAVANALRDGGRGLDGGSSIVRLLAEHRGLRNRLRPPELTMSQILAWADAFRARNGRWPNSGSGPIPEAPGETWFGVENALQTGRRGLPGALSLAQLRDQKRPAKPLCAPSDRDKAMKSSVRRWTPSDADQVS